MKRLFDLALSAVLLCSFLPFFLMLAFAIALDSKGGVFYRQIRIGKAGREFQLLKFRSMRPNSDQLGQLTVGDRDPRITSVGLFLRKSKMDELPQLINILKGDMSWVGPRPEVPKYVDLYSDSEKKVLSVRPGLTDLASIEYIEESELLSKSKNPEETYINQILPHKLALQIEYIENQSMLYDLKLICRTLTKILRTLSK